MNKRLIIFYWLLLLVPTIIIGICAFYLLSHEQERINQLAHDSAMERAHSIAETVQITIEAVEDELTRALLQIPPAELGDTLLRWSDTNPLVRNVFIWQPDSGLEYPLSGTASTQEERRFAARYKAIFSGRIPLVSNAADDLADGTGALAQNVYPIKGKKELPGLVYQIRKFKSGREKLVDLAKGKAGFSADAGSRFESRSTPKEGWLPWFEENRLYILGWVQPDNTKPIYGIELELMSLLSRLIVDFPSFGSQALQFALIDGAGNILHQTGNTAIASGITPDITVHLAPHLPHWQVAGYLSEGGIKTRSKKSFQILSGLMLAIFMAAIVLGGSLLTWQVFRNMTDARQKTSFVSSVSHELKTPLTSIRMYAELLNEDRVKTAEKQKHYLQVIVAESQRLTRLVNNVLDFGRLEQDKKKYQIEKLELTAYLKTFCDAHTLRIKQAGLELKISVPDKNIFILTDRDAIEQIILNLVDNAIKYAADGKEIRVNLESEKSRCLVTVMDRGPGIPVQYRKKIFEKFHRVDDSLTSQQPGSGLGLTIARRILTDLGGDILCEPRQGGGSCFIAIFPIEFEKENMK